MKPTAAPPVFPYPGHRSMADILRMEARRAHELRKNRDSCRRWREKRRTA